MCLVLVCNMEIDRSTLFRAVAFCSQSMNVVGKYLLEQSWGGGQNSVT